MVQRPQTGSCQGSRDRHGWSSHHRGDFPKGQCSIGSGIEGACNSLLDAEPQELHEVCFVDELKGRIMAVDAGQNRQHEKDGGPEIAPVRAHHDGGAHDTGPYGRIPASEIVAFPFSQDFVSRIGQPGMDAKRVFFTLKGRDAGVVLDMTTI